MKLEVQWLAYLATQEGMLDSAKCLVLKHALGPDADLLAFGEKLIDRGYCADVEQLQNLVDQTFAKIENGEPLPNNPFSVLGPSTRASISLSRARTSSPLESTPSEAPSSSVQEESIPSVRRWKPSEVRKSYTRPSQAEEANSAPMEAPLQTLTNTPQPSSRESPPSAQPPAAPAPAPVQTAPTPVPVAATLPPTLELQLSKERPEVSLEVPNTWPDFSAISSMPDQEVRQTMVQLLLMSQSEGASDLHLSANARPFIRSNRFITYLGDYVLSSEDAQKLNTALLSEFQNHEFEKDHDLDYALSLDMHLRYRVNLFEHKDGPSGTYRLIPIEVKSLEELGFSETDAIKKLLTYHNGLIMVTGPMGSGKTTTLAALIDELNRNRQDHIITVESPIEIVQHSHQCQITQREVGSHTRTFHSALKGALRQDPDIIVIGEMRDLETVEMAISASETGHLVIGTMHTSNSANTLNCLLDVFPATQQTQIRSMVAESLRGIICQRLLPSTDGGVALAYELLLNNAAVGNLIRTNKADGLSNIIETGRREGMVLMDKSIFALWEANKIPDEVALANLVSVPMKEQIHLKNQPPVAIEEPVRKKSIFGR